MHLNYKQIDPLEGNLGNKLPVNGVCRDLIGFIGGKERCIFGLIYLWGLSEAEVGYLFDVSESRVSHWVKRIQKRLSARVETEARRESQRENKVEALLRQENKTGSELEQRTFETMEIGKSWQVAVFNETSF